jgi:ATP-binding cassette subfamily F protein 3
MLLRPAPLLVLDEPTNHLDMDSRDALERALESFPGTLVIVSHDRAFLNRLATVVIEVGGGGIDRYEGDYDSYAWERGRRHADQSAPATPVPARGSSSKERRRLDAERRRVLAPLRRELREREQEVHALEARLAALDELLSDPATYEDSLNVSSFQERADLARALESALGGWERAQAALEAAERELG